LREGYNSDEGDGCRKSQLLNEYLNKASYAVYIEQSNETIKLALSIEDKCRGLRYVKQSILG